MLSIREHSEKQIRFKLRQKGYSSKAVNQSVEFLLNENWLCEERFCNAFLRSKAEKGQGFLRIERELLQENISPSLIQSQYEAEAINWQLNCESTLLKKLRLLSSEFSSIENQIVANENEVSRERRKVIEASLSDQKTKLKIESFLRFRGYSNQEIRNSFNKLSK